MSSSVVMSPMISIPVHGLLTLTAIIMVFQMTLILKVMIGIKSYQMLKNQNREEV